MTPRERYEAYRRATERQFGFAHQVWIAASYYGDAQPQHVAALRAMRVEAQAEAERLLRKYLSEQSLD